MNDCHMSWRSKKVWRTCALPGASQKTATSAAMTTIVLAVEMAVARGPPPVSSRGPRPVVPNEPGICPPPRPMLETPGTISGSAGRSCSLSSMGRELGRALIRPVSRLDGRDAEVDLQVLVLQLLQGAVALQRGQRLVDAADERVALGEQQPVVLAGAGELGDHDRAFDLRGGDELRGRRVGHQGRDLVGLQRLLHVVERVEHLRL